MDLTKQKLKGRIIQTYLKYIKKRWGQDGLEDCLRACGIKDIDSIAEDKWYPQKYGVDMAVWVGETHGDEALRQLGFAIATEKGVVSYVAWIAGINKIIDRFEREFRESVQYGIVELERGPKKAKVHMTDVSATPQGCQIYHGMLEGLLHLGKARNGKVKKKTCQHRGDPRCTYVMKWD